ncbi:XRE family transcriptional regulator [Streptomyces eurocidicus]|uniref:Transcriptional regulator with XRE-family HTH domain n=1 Tax=Streptomyces eurocidicus TaxID=66423 RepID=A0A2N8NQQ5_STREU|nr:helix-turn-helix transcriptional regulator [Streptomyces eurocidicus]MBB5116846.1 transcriptional regulator with XRE-family HTH domain [Streptomyces eurocidicus]MBF6052846.1 helix-turn-helix domain-containing protein [Streptomyces eurocidicus]PNE31100.1 XRE family transcriptional regulator [Streptomyces eurocidicus]
MSSSSVQQARQALGQRLREIRKDSGLTARALAALAGWHESKCSRIEHGHTVPSDADIRVWARHCDALSQTEDLVATARNIDGMYVEWRRMERAGLKGAQEAAQPLFERTRNFRMYQSWVIPGLFQTAAYTTAVLNTIKDLRQTPDDIAEAVAVRMERQNVLRSGGHRFAALVEEWVLHTVIGDANTMVGQLGHLISVGSLPSVSLGIIPMGVPRGSGWPVESFTMYDDRQVNVELVSAHLTVTQPREMRDYTTTFNELSAISVYGSAARSLITRAIDSIE